MKLFFEITSGDRQGSRFEIRDGVSIGRKGTDVVIRDSKVSTRHATVEERDHGFFLVDSGSSNGLKTDGYRVSEIHLLPGVVVQLGRTLLTVIDLDEVGDAPEKPVVSAWQEIVIRLLARTEKALALAPVTSDQIKMFTKPVELTAVGGPQTGQTWTIVYGPRDIGSESLDIRLLEEGIPQTAFQLQPSNTGVMLKTEHADKISLNGVAIGKSGQSLSLMISGGDEIAIQNTRLQVKLRDL
jgi:pSer/pThr/pTyr-binding forkhead associated (FHA) protein